MMMILMRGLRRCVLYLMVTWSLLVVVLVSSSAEWQPQQQHQQSTWSSSSSPYEQQQLPPPPPQLYTHNSHANEAATATAASVQSSRQEQQAEQHDYAYQEHASPSAPLLSPENHPQQQLQQEQHDATLQRIDPLTALQGETTFVDDDDDDGRRQSRPQPSMKLEHVSLSLRLTCEMNRQLLQGILRNHHNHADTAAAAGHTKSAAAAAAAAAANTGSNSNNYNPLLQRGGAGTDTTDGTMTQHHPIHIHPSQSWQPPIAANANAALGVQSSSPLTLSSSSSDQQQQPPHVYAAPSLDDYQQEQHLTIFHAKEPRRAAPRRQTTSTGSTAGGAVLSSRSRRGAARWGPPLLTYLHYLLDGNVDTTEQQPSPVIVLPHKLHHKQERSLVLAVALLYLDRACSVETVRSARSAAKCPFVQPRTVHRLWLVALLTAVETTSQLYLSSSSSSRSDYHVQQQQQQVQRIQDMLGIPPHQLQQMMQTFRMALGDAGVYIDPVQLQHFQEKWQSTFMEQGEHESTNLDTEA